MTYHSSTAAAATLTDSRAALDRAAATLDRVDARIEARRLDQRARSLQLVEARGYFSWRPARTVSTRLDASGQRLIALTVRVPSLSRWGVWYELTYDAATDDAPCDCEAAQHNRACFHRGCAINAGRYVARLARLGWPED